MACGDQCSLQMLGLIPIFPATSQASQCINEDNRRSNLRRCSQPRKWDCICLSRDLLQNALKASLLMITLTRTWTLNYDGSHYIAEPEVSLSGNTCQNQHLSHRNLRTLLSSPCASDNAWQGCHEMKLLVAVCISVSTSPKRVTTLKLHIT